MTRLLPHRTRTIRRMLALLALASAAACTTIPPDASQGAALPAGLPADATSPRAAPAAPDVAAAEAVATPRGEPVGEPSTATIGAEGGTLRAPDGRLVLEVPAGAFAAPTRLAIQPITNHSPHGVGGAYRISPEGVAFARPVGVRFEYTPDDARGRAAGGFGIAFQNADGTWSAPTRVSVDEEARSVSVTTDHFSDWTLFEKYALEPSEASVNAGASRQLQVMRCVVAETWDPAVDGLLVGLLPTCEPLRNFLIVRNWSVNGTAGGSPASGTVAADGTRATYTAPGTVPQRNPVAVSVEVLTGEGGRLLLVSNLEIRQRCPVPICELSGTARMETWDEKLRVVGVASVTWTFYRMAGREAIYLPSGSVTAEWDYYASPCRITLHPATHTFHETRYLQPRTAGHLAIDFTREPAVYRGGGSNEWEGTTRWSCPNSPTDEHEGIFAGWFEGSGTVENGGRLVRGTMEEEYSRSSWEFSVLDP